MALIALRKTPAGSRGRIAARSRESYALTVVAANGLNLSRDAIRNTGMSGRLMWLRLASAAGWDRRGTERLGACIAAVARTNPPQSAADKVPAMVNASNVMLVHHWRLHGMPSPSSSILMPGQ